MWTQRWKCFRMMALWWLWFILIWQGNNFFFIILYFIFRAFLHIHFWTHLQNLKILFFSNCFFLSIFINILVTHFFHFFLLWIQTFEIHLIYRFMNFVFNKCFRTHFLYCGIYQLIFVISIWYSGIFSLHFLSNSIAH